MIVLGLVAHPAKGAKDTAANIRATGEFVVHLVDEAHAEAMNRTSMDYPAGVDEGALLGLAMVAATAVRVPRIASSPVGFECRSRSRAACNTDTPRSRTNFTASILNSRLNFRRCIATLQFQNHLISMSTKPGAAQFARYPVEAEWSPTVFRLSSIRSK
jgi:hypothetical protein